MTEPVEALELVKAGVYLRRWTQAEEASGADRAGAVARLRDDAARRDHGFGQLRGSLAWLRDHQDPGPAARALLVRAAYDVTPLGHFVLTHDELSRLNASALRVAEAIAPDQGRHAIVRTLTANLGKLAFNRGHLAEAERFYRRALEACVAPANDRVRGRLLAGLGETLMASERSHLQAALDALESAVDLAHSTGDGDLYVRTLLLLAQGYRRLGDYGCAQRFVESGLDVCDQSPFDELRCGFLLEQGELHLHAAQPELALRRFEASWQVKERWDRSSQENFVGPLILAAQGRAHLALGDWPRAGDCFEQSRILARKMGDSTSEGRALSGLGAARWYDGRPDDARASWAASLEIARRCGDPEGVAKAQQWLERFSSAPT